jgi:2-desacetyl-2-hydroxyethyl bacteriochlorophyllide A dehydrogenase
MKHLKCMSPGNLSFGEEDIPSPGEDEALVRILKIGVCGTDLHAVEGTQPYFTYPRILGHELAVEIVQSPKGSGLTVGSRATLVPYFNCGTCHMCLSGRTNACVNLRVCGVHVDGGMREYLNVPVRNLISSDTLSPDQLALVEPLSVGAHAVRRGEVTSKDRVVVMGAGPIGIATMLFATLQASHVIMLDVNPWRLQFLQNHSAVTTIDAIQPDVVKKVEAITKGEMASVVFDATGNLTAINSGFQYLAHGGRYVLVGLQKGNISFSHPDFHKREATLMSSRNATREDFLSVIEAIKKRQIDPLTLITHRMSFDDAASGIMGLLTPGVNAIKGLIEL